MTGAQLIPSTFLVEEILSPVSGNRIIEFIRNAWQVFFRWAPPDKPPIEERVHVIAEGVSELMRLPEYGALTRIDSYHPTAVITAIR